MQLSTPTRLPRVGPALGTPALKGGATAPVVCHQSSVPVVSPQSPVPSPYCLYTVPFFITNFTRRSALISLVGSPSKATRSANSPGFTEPI